MPAENRKTTTQTDAESSIRIGVSSCVLGEMVRYDGGHTEDRYITRTLGRYFEWVSVCPEVELGLGTPRETLRLVQIDDGISLVSKSGEDLTRRMGAFARTRVRELDGEDLCGYILKRGSPSCGMERVRIYNEKGMPDRSGRGLFAQALLERFPDLPVEEEGRLSDPRLRENWIERVFAYRRLKSLWKPRWTVRDLIEFHTAHKLILLSHHPEAYRSLGRLVASAKTTPRRDLRARYQSEFMEALSRLATRGRHANVLQHMAGHFKKELDGPSRREVLEHIQDYQKGYVPLIVPLTLIKHHVRRFEISYLAGQLYLNPHPKELALRNHV